MASKLDSRHATRYGDGLEFSSFTTADLCSIDIVKLNEAIIDIYIHEIAMHHSHNVDEFRPPFAVDEEHEEQPDYITPAHIDSLTVCLSSIHKACEAFIGMRVSALRSLPTLTFVRTSYAAVALVKMSSSVSAKGSRFGSVFKSEDLKVEYYLDAMVEKMKSAAEGGQSRIAIKFSFVLTMMKNWHASRVSVNSTSKDKSPLNVKNATAGWAKNQQLPAPNQQVPKTDSWNATAINRRSNANAVESQHSGLQMLSEVAMGNNTNSSNPSSSNNTPSDSAAAAAARATLAATTTNINNNKNQALWGAQLAEYGGMQPPQQQQQSIPSMQVPTDFFPTRSMASIDNFTFTPEELGALGNMMDDPSWLSFGLEGAGFGF